MLPHTEPENLVFLSHLTCFMSSVTLYLRFNGHFPGEPGLAGVYWS